MAALRISVHSECGYVLDKRVDNSDSSRRDRHLARIAEVLPRPVRYACARFSEQSA